MPVKGAIHASVLTGSSALGVAPNADVEVRDKVGALAALWTARDGLSSQANPFTADSEGFFEVYATPDRYTLESTVGAEVRTFADIIVHARQEPEPGQFVDIIQRQADITPAQVVELVGVTVLFDVNTVIAPNGSMIVKDTGTVQLIAPGPPGWLKMSYCIAMEMKDGGGAAGAGDIAEVKAQIIAPTARVGGNAHKIFEAQAGYSNLFTLTGEVLRSIGKTDTHELRLEVQLLNRSAAGITMELTVDTRFTIERWLDWED